MRWWLVLALILYGIAFILSPSTALSSLLYALNLLLRLLPAFVLVIVINLLLGILSERGLLPRKGGYLHAVIGGTLSSGPIYAWYPLLQTLKQRGIFNDGHLAAFLYARAVKIPLMPVMASFFGWGLTLLFNAFLLIISPVVGWVTQKVLEVVE